MPPSRTFAALLVGAVACSSHASSDAAPARWTSALCSGFQHLTEHQAALAAPFSAARQRAVVTDPSGEKMAVVSALDAVRHDIATSVAALHQVGPPDVPHGQALQAQLLRDLGGGETQFAQVRDAVLRSADTPAAVAAALQTVDAKARSGSASVNEAFAALARADGGGTLDRAATANPDCKALVG